MVESADLRDGDDLAPSRRFDDARIRSIAVERTMRSGMMIIVEIRDQDTLEMGLVPEEDVVQTLSADRADKAFHERILPGRTRRDADFLDPQALQTLAKAVDVDAVVVADQVTRRLVEREDLADLLPHPCRGRVGCHVEVNDAPPVVTQNDEGIQQPERDRGHDEEIHRRQAADMVGKQGAPGRRRGLVAPPPYLATVDSAMSWPSSRSSARIRGAPQSGFSRLMRRMSRRTSGSMRGRPDRLRDFHRQ